MFKIITLAVCLTVSGLAYASRSQIISLPDGTQMVCFYHNGGRFVDCQKL
jgi:hypothetical protein